jgi:hypothetical protein
VRDLVAGWARRQHGEATVFHLVAALDTFGVDVAGADDLQTLLESEIEKLKNWDL